MQERTSRLRGWRQRTIRAWLSLLGLTVGLCLPHLTGCGQARSPSETSHLVDRAALRHVLRGWSRRRQGGFRWTGLDSSFYWLEEGERRLAVGDGRLNWVGPDTAASALRSAQVIVIADQHALPLCRVALGALVARLASAEDLAGGRVAVVLESVPQEMQPALDAISLRCGDQLALQYRELLRKTWPWPVEDLAVLLGSLRSKGVRLLAAGGSPLASAETPGTPDRARVPGVSRALDSRDFEARIGSVTLRVADVAKRWVSGQAGEPRTAYVLVGGAHIVPKRGGVAQALQHSGLRTAVVVPCSAEWYLASMSHSQCWPEDAWCEVFPWVFFAPLISASDWSRLGESQTNPTREPNPPLAVDEVQLKLLLDSSSAADRVQALRALTAARTIPPDYVPDVLLSLRSGSPEARRTAASALSYMRTPSPVVALALSEALTDRDEIVRSRAVSSLRWLGSEWECIRRVLQCAVRHEDLNVRSVAALALAENLHDTGLAVPVLAKALRRGRGWPSDEAILGALGRLGPLASESLPVVQHLAENATRATAARARWTEARILSVPQDEGPLER